MTAVVQQQTLLNITGFVCAQIHNLTCLIKLILPWKIQIVQLAAKCSICSDATHNLFCLRSRRKQIKCLSHSSVLPFEELDFCNINNRPRV